MCEQAASDLGDDGVAEPLVADEHHGVQRMRPGAQHRSFGRA
jgi:hypothetical protein